VFDQHPEWTKGPGPLQALAANREVVDQLVGWRWAAMREAREQGHGWAEIGTALGVDAAQARQAYLERIQQQQRVHETHLATEGEPGTDELAGLSKVVFSTTLTEPLAWPNTQLVSQDPVKAVREMKDNGTTSMRTLGSLTLCRSLLKAGLVDRFRVVVFPVITGATGRDRIYDGYPDVALDMIASRTFDGRLQLLEYVPTVLAGPPGTTKAHA
jgi:dihydrofolate reductase